jgi:hypothetical protein
MDQRRLLQRWHKNAKKYRLIGHQHTGFSDDGTERVEFTTGDEVMLNPIEYANFKDKFEEIDVKKPVVKNVRKNAADEAHEHNESNKDLLDNPDDAPEPAPGSPVGISTGSGQGPGGLPPNVAISTTKPPTASDSAPTGKSGQRPTSPEQASAGSPQAVKEATGKDAPAQAQAASAAATAAQPAPTTTPQK